MWTAATTASRSRQRRAPLGTKLFGWWRALTRRPRREHTLRVLALAALVPAGAAAPHDIHTSHTRAVVEGRTILWKVRLFTDDLEKGLQAYTARPSLVLAKEPKGDSIFTAYFNSRVGLTADGAKLRATLVQSGTDRDPVGGTVHWYLLQFEAPRTPVSLSVVNTLLTEQFKNQTNIVLFLKMPAEERRTLYFGDGSATAQVVRFDK